MKIEFTGRQTEIPDELRRLVERKLLKLARLLPSVTRAHVTLTADKHRRLAEIGLHSRQLDLAALAVTGDARLSLSRAIEKLARQADRQRTRRQVRKGAPTPRLEPGSPGRKPETDAEPLRVIRSRRGALKPMTLEEAALELESRREGVLVFRDAGSRRVSVLYRRPDGHLGLVEPEA
jgi:putative sigma-54 modulation protein